MDNHTPDLLNGFVGVLLIALFFLASRAFFLWYFKIDKVVALLASIDKKLGPVPEGVEETPQTLSRSIAMMRERFKRFTGSSLKK